MSAPTLDILAPGASAAAVGGELEAPIRALLAEAPDVAITTPDELQVAVLERQAIGDGLKKIAAFFEPIKAAAYRLHRELCAREAALTAPLLERDRARARAMQAFRTRIDQERRQREEELAAEERRRLEAHAAAEAAALERDGAHADAAAVLEEAITAPAPVVRAPDPLADVAGYKTRREYRWRYAGDDPAAAARVIPREYLSVDEKKIGAFARAMKGTGTIPGVEFYAVDVPIR